MKSTDSSMGGLLFGYYWVAIGGAKSFYKVFSYGTFWFYGMICMLELNFFYIYNFKKQSL